MVRLGLFLQIKDENLCRYKGKDILSLVVCRTYCLSPRYKGGFEVKDTYFSRKSSTKKLAFHWSKIELSFIPQTETAETKKENGKHELLEFSFILNTMKLNIYLWHYSIIFICSQSNFSKDSKYLNNHSHYYSPKYQWPTFSQTMVNSLSSSYLTF